MPPERLPTTFERLEAGERAGSGTDGAGGTGRRRALATVALIALIALVGLGVLIRTHGWWKRPSFYVDELRLAINVAERTLPELYGSRLRYGYIVPPGYLALERAAFLAGGRDERPLRLPALLSAVAALACGALLARRVLGPALAPLPVALLACGAPLVAYANDSRPYATDLALGAALPLVALAWLERPTRGRSAALIAAFAVAPLFSFGAAIGGGGALAALALRLAGRGDREGRARWRALLGAAAGWLVVAAVAALPLWLATQGDESMRHGLDGYWTAVGSFPPGGAGAVPEWLAQRFVAFARFPFAPAASALPAAAVGIWLLAGWASLAWKRRDAAALLGLPLLGGLVAGLAGLYPLGGRLVFFYVPATAVAIGALPLALPRSLRERPLLAAGLLAAGLLLSAPIALEAWRRERGYEVQSGRELVAALAANARSADRIFVEYSAEPAWRFYAPASALDPARAAIGKCGAADPAAALPLAANDPPGTRLWMLFSNTTPEERDWLLARLARFARPTEAFDLTAGRRRIERLERVERMQQDATSAADRDAQDPPPRLALWRCAFFE